MRLKRLGLFKVIQRVENRGKSSLCWTTTPFHPGLMSPGILNPPSSPDFSNPSLMICHNQAPGDGKGQESLACCSSWGCKESYATEWLNNNDAHQVLAVLLSWSLIIWSLFPIFTPATITEVFIYLFLFVIWSLCPTVCNPMDFSPPGSSVHGIFQAKILEWVAIPFSRGPSQAKDWTHVSCVSCIAGGFLTCWAIGEALLFTSNLRLF